NITSSILSLVSGFEELGTYLQYASWSPDGSKITYSFRNEVYVMNPDGTGRTRLTNDTNVFVNPKFSPDGSKILVQSIASSSELDLFVINSDGSGSPTNLTSDISGRPTNASWSPDGSKIVYEFDDGSDDEIYTMDSDGANKSQLTDNAIDDNDPEYSPDGLKILFRSNSMLYTMSNTGNTVSQVSDKTAGDSNWSPI
ncbi:MAG: TolB family protein, partial [Candidatus Sericytochromatia bacterium]